MLDFIFANILNLGKGKLLLLAIFFNFGKCISNWKIQCKLPPKTKRFCPLVLK